jgi:hypothetical protein
LPAFDENTKAFEDQLFGANFPAEAALLGLFEARAKVRLLLILPDLAQGAHGAPTSSSARRGA